MTWLEKYRAVSQFHENSALLAFAATPVGALAVWLTAAALLWGSDLTPAVLLVLAGVMLKPERRELIMALGAPWALYILLSPHVTEPLPLGMAMGLIVVVLYGIFTYASHIAHMPPIIKRNSILTLHLLMLTALIGMPVLRGIYPDMPVAFIYTVAMLPHFIWCTGYLVLSARKRPDKVGKFHQHIYYFITMFPSVHVPHGKGHDYLSSRRSQDRDQLAKSQLAGLKLLALAWVWIAVRDLMKLFLLDGKSDLFGVTLAHFEPVVYTLNALIYGSAPANLPIYVAWLSIFTDLIFATLNLAIGGHFVVGVLRLYGFNIFRNTYKPLLAQSIVDFWNRFYYYFKELLVEFFFYPTFLSYFKNSPRLRMFTAVMAAAFIGNTYYHLLIWLAWGEASFITGAGMETRLLPYLFYSFLLGLGVYISMLREQARRGKPTSSGAQPWWVTLRRIAGVWLFFGLVRIWDVGAVATLEQRADFFLSLFGM